jgi:Zn finger protein HypA/HybF involved in hydrogenase expression
MHDVILAKEISDTVKFIAAKHNLKKISEVLIEVGNVEGLHKHGENDKHEEVEMENIEFHLKNFLPDIKFLLQKNKDLEGWKLVEIEGD